MNNYVSARLFFFNIIQFFWIILHDINLQKILLLFFKKLSKLEKGRGWFINTYLTIHLYDYFNLRCILPCENLKDAIDVQIYL